MKFLFTEFLALVQLSIILAFVLFQQAHQKMAIQRHLSREMRSQSQQPPRPKALSVKNVYFPRI